MTLDLIQKDENSNITEHKIENVQHISTGATVKDGKPIYYISVSYKGDHENINIDNVISFSIYERPCAWIVNKNNIECPYCMTHFKKSVLTCNKYGIRTKFCPECGRRLDV